jgi:HK97 family phage major capsid protein
MLKKLIQDRKAFLDKMNAIIQKAEDENSRDLTEAESAEVNQITESINSLDTKIEAEKNRQTLNARQTELEVHANSSSQPRIVPDVNNGPSDGDRRDIANFSFIKAFREQLNGNLSGFELEMHQEAEKDARSSGQALDGLGIPQMILANSRGNDRFRNDLTAGTPTEGGNTIPTELRSVIDILREKLMVRAMGATVLTDLVGNIDFPKAITDSDPTEKGENAEADENSPTFGKISLTPHRLPVVAEVSKQLLIQTSVSIEAWLRNYLAFRIASRMDKMSIYGSGSGDQPEGILNMTGIGSVSLGANGAAPTRASLINLMGEVAQDNADVGRLGFLTNTKVRSTLMNTLVDAGSGKFVWNENTPNSLLGYNAGVSTNVPSNLTKGSGTNLSAIIYGNWESLMIGQWGGLDVLLNPYSKDSQGLIRINMATFYDVAAQHEESFAAIVDAVTS